MNMIPLRIIAKILCFFVWGVSLAESLQDPRLRDEDLSYTELTVEVNHRSDGFYEYIYGVVSPLENKGNILFISLDISCNLEFPPTPFPEPPDEYDRGSLGEPTQHVPVQSYGVFSGSTFQSVGIDNWVGWGLHMRPGEDVSGLRLLSPAPPGPRSYKIVPAVQPDGWDYGSYEEDDPTVPWIEDWTVTGVITGPACALAPPEEPMRFSGTANGPSTDNELLTYSEPLRDRWHVGEEVTEVVLTIHYGERIDPKSFRVEPGWARGQFRPEPGGTETVTLPLKQAVNRFHLRATARSERGPKSKDEYGQPLADHDVFEIRRDVVRPGRADRRSR